MYHKKKRVVLSLFRNNVINVRTMEEGQYPPVGNYSRTGQIIIHMPIEPIQPEPNFKPDFKKANEDVLPSYEMATRMKLFQRNNY